MLSDNFYWASAQDHDYTGLSNLPKVDLSGSARQAIHGNQTVLVATIGNPSSTIALMIRLKLVESQSGHRVLPVFYGDNYFSLLPGETKTVHIEADTKYLHGEKPKLLCEGWNITPSEIISQ